MKEIPSLNRKIYRSSFLLLFAFLIACADPKKVPQDMRSLQSAKASERNAAALELAQIGSPHALPAVPLLIGLLKDENAGVQSSAAYALRKIDSLEAREALERVRRFQH